MKILILFFWLVSCQANAGGVVGSGGVVVDEFVRAIDGDTIVVNVDAWPRLFGEGARIRVRGVDTPELRGKCPREKALARRAKVFADSVLEEAGMIALVDLSKGAFFRVVADVLVDGISLKYLLIKAGLGREYEVKAGRKSWCN